MSALNAVMASVRAAAETMYKATARPLRSIGIGVDALMFERAAVMLVEEIAPGETADEVIARGFFDCTIDDIPVRITRWEEP